MKLNDLVFNTRVIFNICRAKLSGAFYIAEISIFHYFESISALVL